MAFALAAFVFLLRAAHSVTEAGVRAFRERGGRQGGTHESNSLIAGTIVGAALLLVALIGGVSSSSPPSTTASSEGSPPRSNSVPADSSERTTRRRRHGTRHHRPRHHVSSSRTAGCPSAGETLEGVYHPSRLVILDSCRRVTGKVVSVRDEDDGDLHVNVELEPRFQALLSRGNYEEQHGALVVEFMARDGGHLPRPSAGQRIELSGAWVGDSQHSWNELHPVWSVRLDGGPIHRSGPRFGGSPRRARSESAEGTCRNEQRARCTGYGGSGSHADRSSPSPNSSSPATGGTSSAGPDKDCLDFDTQRQAQRYFESKGGPGSDPDRLDADHDGIACQSLPG